MNPLLFLQSLATATVLAFTQSTEPPQPPTAEEIAEANRTFAIRFLEEQRRTAPDANFAFSPLSIRMAMGLMQAGAAGDTAHEIAEAGNLSATGEQTARGYSALIERFNGLADILDRKTGKPSGDRRFDFRIANAVWADRSLPLHARYVDFVRDCYQASAAPLDFVNHPEAARKTINGWVSRATDDRIQDLVPDGAITDETRAVLTNALLFKARWSSPFSERATQDAPFHAPTGTVDRPFMQRRGLYRLVADKTSTNVSLPFEGGHMLLTILVPNEGTDLATFERDLSAAELGAKLTALRKSRTQGVSLAVPKFSIGSECDLTESLEALGLSKCMTADADFSVMSDEPLRFDRAVHKAEIEIDEEGVIAAAASAFMMAVGSAQIDDYVEFRADRPFLFAVHDYNTGLLAFLGRCTKP